jgi:hypothetical protein
MMTLLPVRTGEVLASALGELLAAVGRLVDRAAAGASEAGQDELLAGAWQVAEKTNALRNTIGLLKRGWERLSPVGARNAIGIAEDLAYTARELAFAAADGGPTVDERREVVRGKANLLRRELDAYCAEIKGACRRFHCHKPGPPAVAIRRRGDRHAVWQ